jgi:AcrR family transcriptional regulator
MPASPTPVQPADTALIMAAIELFGRDGFAAASTRVISEQAGTNIASIKYYFGSKEELYKAAVVHVAEQVRPGIEFALAAFKQGQDLAGQDSIVQARLIKQLVAYLLQFFLTNKDIPHFMPFVLREFFIPGPHFSIFYEAVPRQVHELLTQMIAMVDGSDPASESTIIRAHAVLGQVMMFHVGREVLFRRLDWQTYTPARVELITTEVQSLVLNALKLAAPDEEMINGE